jgi:hypothetical protein
MLSGVPRAEGGTLPPPIPPTLPDFGAATFDHNSSDITNPLFPMASFFRRIYQGEKDEDGEIVVERVVEDYLAQSVEIMGVRCRVINVKEYEDDLLVEETFDWYAQDTAGFVWYMGELATNYEYDDDGNLIDVNNDGSWTAGDDGALPGYIMEAPPLVGDSYYQEYYLGEAEDEAQVTSLSESVVVPYGSFPSALQTFDTTALEVDALEFKYYAPGIGLVLEEELELVEDGEPGEYEVVFRMELVDTQTPEPTTLSLLLLGAAGVLRRRRKS